jgi:putative restriction endonuclease
MKQAYINFINEQNIEGSRKAPSYIRALDLLGPILKMRSDYYSEDSNIWNIQSVYVVTELYNYVLEQQKLLKQDKGIFVGEKPVSYWSGGFCSAALKSYKEFLILQGHEKRLWKIYRNPKNSPEKISTLLDKEKIAAIEELVPDKDIDFSTKTGKDVLRSVKARVNQSFFRKMILSSYNNQCCITGLDIPRLLIASHIKPWSIDKNSRLNPCNGLCLNALHDKAFDTGLITVDTNKKIVISKAVKEHYTIESVKTYFEAYDNKTISLPNRFLPDKQFLEYHRNKIFQG